MELLLMRKHFLKPGNDSRNIQSMDAHYSQARTSICMHVHGDSKVEKFIVKRL
jgi:hypothetical protein